jgi:hypothetical protein
VSGFVVSILRYLASVTVVALVVVMGYGLVLWERVLIGSWIASALSAASYQYARRLPNGVLS